LRASLSSANDAPDSYDALDSGDKDSDERDLQGRRGCDDELAALELQVAEDLDR
jgi:hypothetical protein